MLYHSDMSNMWPDEQGQPAVTVMSVPNAKIILMYTLLLWEDFRHLLFGLPGIYHELYRKRFTTYLGKRQGLEEVLACPGEAEGGVCLSLITAAASGEQKMSQVWFQISNTGTNKKPLTCLEYSSSLKGAVHPKIKNTYFPLTFSAIYQSR